MGSLTKLRRFGNEISIATADMDIHFGQVIKNCWVPMSEEVDRAAALFAMKHINEHVVHVLKHCCIEGQFCSPNTSDKLGKELEKYLNDTKLLNSSYLWLGWKRVKMLKSLDAWR